MLRTVYWFMMFGLYLVITVFFAVYYKVLGKLKGKKIQGEYLHKVTSIWGQHMVKLTGSKVEVEGLENIPEETVLFVSNHQGNFDIPTLLGFVPKLKGFVAKKELKKIPMISLWMKWLKCLFMDRQDPRQSLKTILMGIEYLKNGHSMVIFPEGTRSKGGPVGEFKKGSFKLAVKAGVPIVPITINGTYKLLEETGRIRKSSVHIKIHPPIETKGYNPRVDEDLAVRVRNIIISG